jgi:hypothetical protein
MRLLNTSHQDKKIVDLLEKNVFQSMNRNDVSTNARIFDFRFVNEIKNSDMNKAFEKSRLIVQAFDDSDKNLILTQSLIIQRVSQRLIVCLVATFSKMKLYFRDIIQTYV